MLGTPLLFGVDTSYVESMVQIPGTAWRMEAGAFKRELETNAPLRARLLRYSEALQAQIAQTTACNGRHGLEQRLARWLLMAHAWVGADVLPLTQDFIATMLGVHRPSITVTAGILQRRPHPLRRWTDHRARPVQPRDVVLRMLRHRQAPLRDAAREGNLVARCTEPDCRSRPEGLDQRG